MTAGHCVKTTCAYCGVGCGLNALIDNEQMVDVSGDSTHPANLGKLCVKGSTLHETLGEHGRLLAPRVEGREVDWAEAITAVADRLSAIRDRHGPQAIAFYLSGQLLTEDYYVANKLAKGFIGTGNVDTNSRLCMSSAVAAYKRAFGADAVPCNYRDLETCDLLVLAGSNAAWTHPVLYRRMVEAKERNPKMRVVVLDPRRTASCDLADLHLPIKPGSDAFVFNGLLNYLARDGHTDPDYIDRHTQGFDQALKSAGACDLATVAKVAGLGEVDLERFYRWYAATKKVVSFYSMGINQSSSGTDKCNAIINCHLATGRIGYEGAGPFSITGQPNAMGGREVGGLANTLAAHMDYTEENVSLVGEFWGSDTVSQKPGLKAVELFEAVASGDIKAIWIMGTNPVVSMPDADRVKAALEQCETVIVSDCIAATDTTATADILLPAMGWGEKDGTVTNSERCISRQRGCVPAVGAARPDWWILSQVALAMGYGQAFGYDSPRDIFVEHARLSGHRNTGERLFDISALALLSEPEYQALEPIQWPVTPLSPQGTARLFEHGQYATPSGHAHFVAVKPQLPKQRPNRKFPFALNTGRIRDQWHSMTRTGRAARLLQHIDQPFVAIHPVPARMLGAKEGDLLRVSNKRGAVEVIAVLDDAIPRDQLFIPIHWNDQFASSARVDMLVAPTTDPISGQPEFKFTPATVAPVRDLRWASLVSREKLDCAPFRYWSNTPLDGGSGYLYRIAVEEDFNWQDYLADRRSRNDGPAQACEQYWNAVQEDLRLINFSNRGIELALFCHREQSELPSAGWLKTMLALPVQGSYWPIIAGRDNATASDSADKLICACFQVSEMRIIDAIENGACTAAELGRRLKCGTNCGSCIPELNSLISHIGKAQVA